MFYNKRVLKTIQTSIFTVFVLFFSCIIVIGQDAVPSFLFETDWLEISDQKKWDKLIEKHKEADILLKQSNDLNLEAGELAQEAGTDYEKNQKKVAKLEKEAMDIYAEALEEYKGIYEDMHDVIENYLGENDKKHAAYSEMISFSEEAANLYREVKKVETESDKEKITRANEMQLASIEKGIMIFTTPSQSIPKPQNAAQSSTPAVYQEGDVILDNELYQKYKRYISDSTIPDPIVAEQLMSMEGDAATFAAFKELWQQYSSEEGAQNQLAQVQTEDTSIVAQVEEINTESNTEETYEMQQDAIQEEFNREQKESETLVKSAIEATKTREYASSSVTGSQNDFRVQIAASKAPMSLPQLNAIYPGDYSILEYKEGSYYRYQIRGFKLFTDAQSVCSNTGVENAYILAYKESSSVPLMEAIKEARSLEQEVKNVGRLKALQSIEFTVQIAASRVRMSPEQLESVYSGNYKVSTVFEEGWYKYQILAGNDLKFALDALETCGVPKAYLVAYKNGKKIKLYKALNEYKTYMP